MDQSRPKATSRTLEEQLVQDLETMRDSLTKLSLVLHDLRFMVEQPAREEAGALAADCIARSRSGQK